jgi:hypothetical protein
MGLAQRETALPKENRLMASLSDVLAFTSEGLRAILPIR